MGARREPDYASDDREELRRASRRFKRAQAGYARFVSDKPLTGVDVPIHSGKEMGEARAELQAAEAELKRIYAEHLRRDSKFRSRSEEADKALSQGPPWDDAFSPNDSMNRDDREQ